MALPPLAKRYMILHLRAARQTRGVPVAAVARRFGHPVETVEDIEAGKTGWSAAEVQILCRWYGLDVTDIFSKPKLRLVAPAGRGAQLPP
ncbi:MAG: helix-turn-helix transcriptional regulator [Hyphomicrobium sp.]|nr:helix-turn-helix transcriptional regulator [Hyphomicrobium sp.]